MNILKINGEPLTGIWVDAAQSFNKPAKNVSTYSIPGRNGDLVIDEGTFENVLISYPVYEKSTFPAEFDEIVNMLAALEGYQRIECSNDPNHYRMGRFVVPEAPTAKRLNKDGYYTLSFDCKPQRWLLSGEEDTEIDANPIDEYSGDIVSFDAGALDEITELKAAIEPTQSGSGDPSPTNIRPISGHTEVNVYRTGKNLYSRENGAYNVPIYATDGSSASYPDVNAVWIPVKPNTLYTIASAGTESAAFYVRWISCTSNKGFISRGGTLAPNNFPYTVRTPANCYWVEVAINQYDASRISRNDWEISVVEGNSTSYEPYAGQTYNVPLGQTVYGGTLNVSTGVLNITYAIADLGAWTWNYESAIPRFYAYGIQNTVKRPVTNTTPSGMVSDCFKVTTLEGNGETIYGGQGDNLMAVSMGGVISVKTTQYTDGATFKSAMNGRKIAYPLATPTTVQLTATQVSTLLGANNIWADTGDVEVKVTSPTVFNNPSLFNSKPLIRVYGVGTFRVNDVTVTIASHDKPYIDIDSELQECFYESMNMNQYVSFSGNDFPVLRPGDNYVLMGAGITKLEVTPRWWIL